MVSIFSVLSHFTGGSLRSVFHYTPLDSLSVALCHPAEKEELKYNFITDPLQVSFNTVNM